tara:strand:- start:1144 stop:1893 length:750 start_codon:yes stop_codon:yes gene_type:complete
MNAPDKTAFETVGADSWSHSVTHELERSRRTAWIIACVASAIAFLLAIALIIMLPLKETLPYTLLVDRQTGHVEALDPLAENTISPDAALTRSFLAQYVVARESFAIEDLGTDYRKVALWSGGEARQRYVNGMREGGALNPLTYMPSDTRVTVDIRSISTLEPGRSLVRYTSVQTEQGGRSSPPQYWAAVIDHEFSGAAMSADDRLLNPIGFQVTRYRKDPETLPETMPADGSRLDREADISGSSGPPD